MSDVYRVPRVQIAAQIQTVGRQVRYVTMFLGDRAGTHDGPERPSDVLNVAGFMPAIERDAVVFISIDAIILLTVDAELEFGVDETASLVAALGADTHRHVVVQLDDGTTVQGDLTYVLPEGHRRIQDYLNSNERFFALRDGDRAHLVHKRHVVLVTHE